MPDWYAQKCDALSFALHHGYVTELEAAGEIEFWHPIALRDLGSPRASTTEKRILAHCERLIAEGARWADAR